MNIASINFLIFFFFCHLLSYPLICFTNHAFLLYLRSFRGTILIEYSTSSSASGLQWLSPAETVGKVHPYLFSQCQVVPYLIFNPNWSSFNYKLWALNMYKSTTTASLSEKSNVSDRILVKSGWCGRQHIKPSYLYLVWYFQAFFMLSIPAN